MSDRLLLCGGTVVDGTGAPAQPGDVLLEGDRVAAVLPPGAYRDAAVAVYDATGLHVTPGFIDVHSHDDLAVVRDPWLLPKLSQGVTTVVIGNCGHGAAPVGVAHPAKDGVGPAVLGPMPSSAAWHSFDDYLCAVAAAAPAVNVAFLVAHNALRLAVCGEDSRAATPEEISSMADLVSQAREAGALGLSTGLGYEPANSADADEISALASRFGEHGLYVTHLRDEADQVAEAIDEALEIGSRSGTRVHVSHVKCAGERNWGRMPALLEQIASAGATGDVYPYTAASTALRPALGAVGGAPLVPERYIIATAPGHEELEGRSLRDLADAWSCTGEEAASRILALTDDNATVVYFTMTETDVAAAIGADHMMIGSDGLPVGGRPHPRMWGAFPRVLRHHVDHEPRLAFEAAVHRMTGLPALTFGLVDRGVVTPGAFADLVIVDRDAVADRATYESPLEPAAGVHGVLVNGAWALDAQGRGVDRAGRVLRRAARQKEAS